MADHVVFQQSSTQALDALLSGRDVRWYKGHLLKLTLIIGLVLLTSMTNGYDGSMMNGLQTVENWQIYFNRPTGSLLGIFNAIQSIGGIAGLPFSAFIADRFGRRFAIFFGSCIMMVGVALQTGAQNIGMFIGARFLIGFGLTFACTAAPLLITELAFPTYRGPLTSLYNSSWYLGSIVAAWATFGTFRINNTWSWRVPSLLQGLPSIFQMALIWFIPESPRWLINNGRVEEARRFFSKHHCAGDETDPLVEFEMQEVQTAIQLEREAAKGSTWASLFKGRGNLKRMRVIIAIAFFSQWSGNGLVSYYLNSVLISVGVANAETRTLINGILQIFNYATAIFGALMCDRIGRRPLFIASCVGMTTFFALCTTCAGVYNTSAVTSVLEDGTQLHSNLAAGRAFIGMIFLYYASYNIAFSPLLVAYTVEILPFRIRAKGLVIMNLAVNCSLVFNQYANPVALDSLGWKYYIVYAAWLLVETVFCWFFIIETKGKTLEETAAIFDGDEHIEKIQGEAAQAVPTTGYEHDLEKKTSPAEHTEFKA